MPVCPGSPGCAVAVARGPTQLLELSGSTGTAPAGCVGNERLGAWAGDAEPWTGSQQELLDQWSKVRGTWTRQECRDKAGKTSDRNTGMGGRAVAGTGRGEGQDTGYT